MNDLIPILIFVGCMTATCALVHMCELLRPSVQPLDPRSVGGPERTQEAAR